MKNKNSHRKGFTLIELLVVITKSVNVWLHHKRIRNDFISVKPFFLQYGAIHYHLQAQS